MKMNIGIIDYGFCNINSVVSACKELTSELQIINTPNNLMTFDKIILPGVGNFENAAEVLNSLGFSTAIKDYAAKGKHLLGICLGMQLLLHESEESQKNLTGLDVLDGKVIDLKGKLSSKQPIPHMGWSEVKKKQESPILESIPDTSSFYFANRYYCEVSESNVVANFDYGGKSFPAIISNNKNIFGVQFHPEKSQTNGLKVINNFFKC